MGRSSDSKCSRSRAAEFASLWAEADAPPDVIRFLQSAPNATLREKADVLLVDQRNRWRRGIGMSVEEYLERVPEIADVDTIKFELITEELGYREESGEQPDLGEFIDRFPDLGEWGFDDLTMRLRDDEIPSPTDLICNLLEAEEGDETRLDLSLQAALSRKRATQDSAVHATQETDVPFLSRCQHFSRLPMDVVACIEAEMHVDEFAAGNVLLQQGDPGTELMVLASGVAEVVTKDEQGSRYTIGRAGRGDVIGEMALLSEEPRSADVVARTDVRALVLPAETFHRLAEKFIDISVVLTELVATRLGGRTRDVLADKTLGGYQIKRRLGRGGMAIVYEARHCESDERLALKMMSHRLVHDIVGRQRFQREADIVESFDHPNICRVHSRFAAFHTYFMVMEFCDGITIEALMQRRGSLPDDEIKKILGQFAAALEYAHRAGIAHRDIKPSNLMILRDGTVKLMDFGLAAPFAERITDNTGSLVGTPRYMAPEQLRGLSGGQEVDYFALGAVAYELIRFRPLFPSMDLAWLIDAHVEWDPQSFAEVCPEANEEISRALNASLAREPENRQLDLDQLAAWSAPVDVSLFLR
jgi:CRP-like cAMP-binding protein